MDETGVALVASSLFDTLLNQFGSLSGGASCTATTSRNLYIAEPFANMGPELVCVSDASTVDQHPAQLVAAVTTETVYRLLGGLLCMGRHHGSEITVTMWAGAREVTGHFMLF